MNIKLTRTVGESLSLLLADVFDSNMETADVALLCSDQTVLKAHKCILSISPVLKEVLMCVDSRLDKVAYISMASFDREDVESFLKFLYKGFIDLDSSSQNVLKIFRALNVNPPVLKHKKTMDESVNIEQDDDLTEINGCVENIDEDEAKFKIFIDIKNNVIEDCDSFENVDCMKEVPADTGSIIEDDAFINRSSALEAKNVQEEVTSSNQVSDPGNQSSKSQELPSVSSKKPRLRLSKKLKDSKWIVRKQIDSSVNSNANPKPFRRISTRKRVQRFLNKDLNGNFSRFSKFKCNVSIVKKSNRFKVKGKLFCEECKKSVMAHNFKRHKNDVHGSKKDSVSCPHCNSLFKNKNSRQVHLKAFCSVLKSKK